MSIWPWSMIKALRIQAAELMTINDLLRTELQEFRRKNANISAGLCSCGDYHLAYNEKGRQLDGRFHRRNECDPK